jgi:5'-methylthioadenosine phosphorylase
MTASRGRIGLIGGSGLYGLPGLVTTSEVRLETPFGRPSDAYVVGELSGTPVAFLARHSRKHDILPSEINFRANVWGFKELGCDVLISASACGSMKEAYRPTDLVLPDQFIDRTQRRGATFFGDGCVAHVSLAHPVCPHLLETLDRAARDRGARVHTGGVYLGMEGPQFSTKAESFLYRSWGVDVIGMTNVQEAKLCREAEICYATMALVTDYDCWHEEEQAVNVETILDVLRKNAGTANAVLAESVPRVDAARRCECRDALRDAVLTRREDVPEPTRKRLSLLLEKYWK